MSDWKGWHGGECPVPEGTLVDVKHRNGATYYCQRAMENWGAAIDWSHKTSMYDIIAYRLHETDAQRIDRLERSLSELARQMRGDNAAVDSMFSEKWEPPTGQYWVHVGEVFGPTETEFLSKEGRLFGIQRPARELAEKARDAMRIHNRALAYVHEHCPDWDGAESYEVIYSPVTRDWMISRIGSSEVKTIGTVTGPKWVMQKLADDLNAGKVEL